MILLYKPSGFKDITTLGSQMEYKHTLGTVIPVSLVFFYPAVFKCFSDMNFRYNRNILGHLYCVL